MLLSNAKPINNICLSQFKICTCLCDTIFHRNQILWLLFAIFKDIMMHTSWLMAHAIKLKCNETQWNQIQVCNKFIVFEKWLEIVNIFIWVQSFIHKMRYIDLIIGLLVLTIGFNRIQNTTPFESGLIYSIFGQVLSLVTSHIHLKHLYICMNETLICQHSIQRTSNEFIGEQKCVSCCDIFNVNKLHPVPCFCCCCFSL